MQKHALGTCMALLPTFATEFPQKFPRTFCRFCFERCPMVFTMVSACFYYGVFKFCLSFCSEISAHLGWNWKNWMNWKNWKVWHVWDVLRCETCEICEIWRWCSMLMLLMLFMVLMLLRAVGCCLEVGDSRVVLGRFDGSTWSVRAPRETSEESEAVNTNISHYMGMSENGVYPQWNSH